MAESLDFQIDGTINGEARSLKFRAAISDKFPYARGTADFRKEQFDSAPTVGDQSLSGWWTRGQLSFHKGAGVKYYEVLDGEEILNRYSDSINVSIGEPGEVTLGPNLAASAIACRKAVAATLEGVPGVVALSDAGVRFYDGSTSTLMVTSDGGAPTDITTDGRYYYVTNGNKIERQSSTLLERTNHVTNPSFETNLTGWLDWESASGWSRTILSRDSTRSASGTYSMKVTLPSGSFINKGTKTTVSGLTVGQNYRLSAKFYVPSGSTKVYLAIGTSPWTSPTISAGVWTEVSVEWTATSTSTEIVASLPEGVTGNSFYLDSVMMVELPYEGAYFDGGSVGATWLGTPHASKTQYQTTGFAASSTVLWQMSSVGVTWAGVWWAKGRLWAVDDDGRWYTLSTIGGSVATSAAFWVSGQVGGWTLAESPSAVYLGAGVDVYAVSIGTDGSVPTINAPVVAATLPAAETLSYLAYYLGHLILTSNAGVRVGIPSTNGDLVYGPLVIEGNFAGVNTVAARGTTVIIPGASGDSPETVLHTLDLKNTVTDLEPAWSRLASLGTAAVASGAIYGADNVLYAWGTDVLYAASALAGEGSLTTGYHRFGTLDRKHFATVLVRAAGDGGTVKVYRVDADGTETQLSVIDPAEDPALTQIDVATLKDATFDIGLTGPVERIALKFVLTRDAVDSTLGPELLGYQIKALPAPVRQRLIKWPLLVMDKVKDRNRVDHGRRGAAWELWRDLEALEEEDALVTYTDHRTGETGQAFIESTELQTETPSQGASTGFGGVGYLTLRRVS